MWFVVSEKMWRKFEWQIKCMSYSEAISTYENDSRVTTFLLTPIPDLIEIS